MTSPSPAVPRSNGLLKYWPIVLLLIFATVLRTVVVFGLRAQLGGDPDGYVAHAIELAEFGRYTVPDSPVPTAYRPPLYPLVIAPLVKIPFTDIRPGAAALAVLQILLGTLTVFFTWLAASAIAGRWGSLLAALLVACDPLLIRYTVEPMTETLCGFLLAAWLAVLLNRPETPTGSEPLGEVDPATIVRKSKPVSLFSALLLAVLFAAMVLARPTFWAVGVLLSLWWVIRFRRVFFEALEKRRVIFTLFITLLFVSPWVVRNRLTLGHPIVTTTHGGYTLLLANNEVFYREVVNAPFGTVWEKKSLIRWQVQLQREHAVVWPHEVARDRALRDDAIEVIRDQPGDFVKSSGLRFLRFWNVFPLGQAGNGIPRPMIWAMALYFASQFGFMLLGLIQAFLSRDHRAVTVAIPILAFTLVHLVYWSNTRMRAPIVPAIAVLAAFSLPREGNG